MEQQSPFSTLIIFAIFGVIFYFMIYRPQAKRNKAHKELMASLGKGSEVLTSGGLVGKITKIKEDYVVLELNANNEVTIKRDFIVAVLPKGSLES